MGGRGVGNVGPLAVSASAHLSWAAQCDRKLGEELGDTLTYTHLLAHPMEVKIAHTRTLPVSHHTVNSEIQSGVMIVLTLGLRIELALSMTFIIREKWVGLSHVR